MAQRFGTPTYLHRSLSESTFFQQITFILYLFTVWSCSGHLVVAFHVIVCWCGGDGVVVSVILFFSVDLSSNHSLWIVIKCIKLALKALGIHRRYPWVRPLEMENVFLSKIKRNQTELKARVKNKIGNPLADVGWGRGWLRLLGGR